VLYLQHIDPHSAQRAMNGLIQQLVPQIAAEYAEQLDACYGPLQENEQPAVVGSPA